MLVHSQLCVEIPSWDKSALLKKIEDASYDFDRVTLNKLKGLDGPALRAELQKVASIFAVQRDFDTTGLRFPNIYIACGDMQDRPKYCDGKKLIVNQPIDGLVDILSADLTDPLKSQYILNNIWTDLIADWLAFTRVPNEIITVYRLDD